MKRPMRMGLSSFARKSSAGRGSSSSTNSAAGFKPPGIKMTSVVVDISAFAHPAKKPKT